jgi:hypothetical protein
LGRGCGQAGDIRRIQFSCVNDSSSWQGVRSRRVVLRGIGDSSTRGFRDLDTCVCQASDFHDPDQQQNEYRHDQGELYEGLPFVFP